MKAAVQMDHLQRKTEIYERLQQCCDEDVDAVMKDNLLVDFDRQFHEQQKQKKSSIQETTKTITYEPMVEFEDEFGRTRRMPQREWEQLQREQQEQEATDLIEQLRRESARDAEDKYDEEVLPQRYDDSLEVARGKGVGFYRFSRAEEERQQQMDALQDLRQSTVDQRTKHMIASEQKEREKEARLKRIAERRSRLQPKDD